MLRCIWGDWGERGGKGLSCSVVRQVTIRVTQEAILVDFQVLKAFENVSSICLPLPNAKAETPNTSPKVYPLSSICHPSTPERQQMPASPRLCSAHPAHSRLPPRSKRKPVHHLPMPTSHMPHQIINSIKRSPLPPRTATLLLITVESLFTMDALYMPL